MKLRVFWVLTVPSLGIRICIRMIKPVVITLALVLFPPILISCFSPAPPPPGELKVISHRMIEDEFGLPKVSITVKNIGSYTIGLARIEVTFYDSRGEVIETAEDSIPELKPSESWDFEIPCRGLGCERIKSYEIKTTAITASKR